jgi:NAD(P) transhydrogenase subunit alpha
LSSQATVAGYKAALMAANASQRFFPMLTTAAGTIRPSQVLVIGAGVAGLQAIATARRLGALVSAYDIRPAAREQVESLGAKMIQTNISADAQGGYARPLTPEEQQAQQEALQNAVAKADAVICTALIPGRPAPKIITRAMVESMPPGAIIIDIAASQGGNCELTAPGETIEHQSVTISGPLNLASLGAHDASQMYAKNIVSFLGLLIQGGQLTFNWEDPILKDSVLTHEGRITHEPTRIQIEGGAS